MPASLTATGRVPSAPTSSPRARRLVVPALVASAVLIFAACSSSGSDTNTSSDNNTTSDTANSTAVADVETAEVSELGTILVDADGSTLYTLTDDGTAVECTGGCLAAWPPLLLAADTDTPTGSDDVTGLGTVASSEGEQITHDGLRLYRLAGDSAPGDTTGESIASFGGVWKIVNVTPDDGRDAPEPTISPRRWPK